ncbi:MAG: hypothetical protein KDC54_10035, partial [Lewinella sp.]|nr:hypothetical protein [Lewinella sp.]
MRVTAAATQAEWTVFAAYHYGGSGREDWVMPPLQRRLAGQPLRAYFMAKMAEWALVGLPGYRSWRWQYGRRARLLRRQLPFIFECIITIQYLHNQILDGKSGVVTPARINSNLLAANLLKDQLMRYLDGELPASVRPRVKAAVHRCFAWVDYGQHLEKSTNLGPGTTEVPAWADCLPEPLRQSMDLTAAEPFLRKIKADLPAIHHEVVDTYFHRIYLTCAFLFTEGANLLIQLLRPSARVATAMRGFSLNYGLMRQLVNDNADWLPRSLALATQARRADDAFSDLRNGTLTLPLIYFRAEHPHGNLLALLGRRDALAEVEENRYFAEMLH